MTFSLPQAVHDCFSRGDIPGTIAALESCIAQDQSNLELKVILIELFVKIGAPEKAAAHLEALYALHQTPEIATLLASQLELSGSTERAALCYEKALTLSPTNIELLRAIVRTKKQISPETTLTTIAQAAPHFKENQEILEHVDSAYQSFEQKIHKTLFRKNEPILFIGVGHAAGSYITGELSRRLGMYMWREYIAAGPGYLSYLQEQQLERLLRIGGVSHTHMGPHKESKKLIEISGLQKAIIQVRDPRQIMYSNTHWMLEVQKRSTMTPGISKYELPLLETYLGKEYFSLSFSQQLDWMIENELPIVIWWMQGWIEFSKEMKSKGKNILVLRFEDFKKDYAGFFKSILDLYNIPQTEWTGEELICKPTADGRPGVHAFRKGSLDEWRREMTPAQKARCKELIPDSLLVELGYDPEI